MSENKKYETCEFNSNVIEMSNADIHGRVRVKMALHEVFDDTAGTNENGINWLRTYVEKNMHTVEGMSLKVHFGDDEKTIATGHGFLETEDGEPRFESEIIGNFNSANPKIERIMSTKGEVNALTAFATVDSFMYPKFTSYLREAMQNGEKIDSSVEIMSTKKGNAIKYLNGWNQDNRTPTDYVYGGHAILGIRPADEVAVMLEVAEAKKQNPASNEFDNLRQKVAELNTKKKRQPKNVEMNNVKEETKLNEEMKNALEALKTEIISEINNAVKSNVEVNDLKEALDKANVTVAQLQEQLKRVEEEEENLKTALKVNEEKEEELIKAIAEKELQNQVMALNSAVAKEGFTEDDLKLAGDLVDKFKADPKSIEVNAIVNAIKAEKYTEVSQKLAEKEKEVTHEENSLRITTGLGDIFGSVENFVSAPDESGSMF